MLHPILYEQQPIINVCLPPLHLQHHLPLKKNRVELLVQPLQCTFAFGLCIPLPKMPERKKTKLSLVANSLFLSLWHWASICIVVAVVAALALLLNLLIYFIHCPSFPSLLFN